MEAAPPEVIVTVSEEAVESGPNSFILFLIFLPTFLIAYLIPFLATLYSKNNARKWIFYWIAIILASLVLRPVLNFILGAYGGAFMFLVVAAVLLYTSNNEKSDILVDASNILLNIAQQQWKNIIERLESVAKQYGMIE